MTASPGAPPGPPPAAFAASTPNLASSSASGAGATIPGPPRIVNLYHVRTVATPKQCYVCHRETTTCLATDGVTDFLYTCKHHLLDPGASLFAVELLKKAVAHGTPFSRSLHDRHWPPERQHQRAHPPRRRLRRPCPGPRSTRSRRSTRRSRNVKRLPPPRARARPRKTRRARRARRTRRSPHPAPADQPAPPFPFSKQAPRHSRPSPLKPLLPSSHLPPRPPNPPQLNELAPPPRRQKCLSCTRISSGCGWTRRGKSGRRRMRRNGGGSGVSPKR
jgi:hypothetical protein